MPKVGIRFGGATMGWDEAMEASEQFRIPFPPPLIVYAMEQRNDQVPSASVITGCLRQFELKRTVPYYVDLNNELAPLFGTAFHDLMDRYRQRIMAPGDLAESRLTVEVPIGNGVTVPFSGKMDYMRPGALISDWKTKRFMQVGFTPPRTHIRQVNIYNYLAAKSGYEPAPKWELVYVTQGWLERFSDATREVDVVEDFVVEQLRDWHDASSRGALPPPVPELYDNDAKGKMVAPCSYCEVREQCLAALQKEEDAPFS